MGTFYSNSFYLFTLLKGVILLVLCTKSVTSIVCGAFYSVSGVGQFSSPNYPNVYPNNTRCIWVLEAPPSHRVFLQIDFMGQDSLFNSRNICNDYIEIRDGSSTSNLVLSSCGTLMSHNVTSTARWLWVLFHSDSHTAASGLHVTYSSVYAGAAADNASNPLVACRTHEFTCANKQCISNSYRCDKYPDCGCGDEGCDEEGCGGLTMNYAARLAMGIGIGFGIFIFVCMISLLWERRHNWARLRNRDVENKNKNKR